MAENDNRNQARAELDAKLRDAIDRAGGSDQCRSIHIDAATYERLAALCDAIDTTVSAVVERLVAAYLDGKARL